MIIVRYCPKQTCRNTQSMSLSGIKQNTAFCCLLLTQDGLQWRQSPISCLQKTRNPRSHMPVRHAYYDRLQVAAIISHKSIDGMARIRTRFPSISKRTFVPLTNEEFESLKEVSIRPMRRTIPDKHRDCLIAAGYIRELVPNSSGVSALALTGAGIRRLEAGK